MIFIASLASLHLWDTRAAIALINFMFRSSLRLKALFCKKPLKPPEIFSEDKLLTMAKMASIAMMVVMAGVSGYFWLT